MNKEISETNETPETADGHDGIAVRLSERQWDHVLHALLEVSKGLHADTFWLSERKIPPTAATRALERFREVQHEIIGQLGYSQSTASVSLHFVQTK